MRNQFLQPEQFNRGRWKLIAETHGYGIEHHKIDTHEIACQQVNMSHEGWKLVWVYSAWDNSRTPDRQHIRCKPTVTYSIQTCVLSVNLLSPFKQWPSVRHYILQGHLNSGKHGFLQGSQSTDLFLKFNNCFSDPWIISPFWILGTYYTDVVYYTRSAIAGAVDGDSLMLQSEIVQGSSHK